MRRVAECRATLDLFPRQNSGAAHRGEESTKVSSCNHPQGVRAIEPPRTAVCSSEPLFIGICGTCVRRLWKFPFWACLAHIDFFYIYVISISRAFVRRLPQ